MAKNLSPAKIIAIVAGSVFTVLVLLFILGTIVGPQQRSKREKRKQSDTTEKITEPTNEEPAYVLTEQDYIRHYQSQWDSVTLKFDYENMPQYGDYYGKLSELNEQMALLADENKLPELEKLRNKLINGKKMVEAEKNYLTYGQPQGTPDITYPCQEFLTSVLNDPGSLDIEKTATDKTKYGWQVKMKYRAKNGFGAKILSVATFDVRFNPVNKSYYVKDADI